MAYGSGQPASVPQNQTATQRLADRVNGLNEEVNKLRERLSMFADRVGGSEPTDKPPLGPAPVPNGFMNQITQSIEDLQKSVGDCHSLMVRIERIG